MTNVIQIKRRTKDVEKELAAEKGLLLYTGDQASLGEIPRSRVPRGSHSRRVSEGARPGHRGLQGTPLSRLCPH